MTSPVQQGTIGEDDAMVLVLASTIEDR